MTTATTSPNPQQVLELFQKITAGTIDWKRPCGTKRTFSRRRIYTMDVVIWLMMLQRLLPRFTLTRAVQHLALCRDLLGKGQKTISMRAGAFCRARAKLPTIVANQVFDSVAERLSGWLPQQPILPGCSVFVLDGSTLSLPHTTELLKVYPPSQNQHAPSHWPMIRLVVAQDVQTGLALRPQWGAYNGPNAVSEQHLALQALAYLPTGAVVIADRNFGVFGVAYAAQQRQHPVLLRLTKARAERLNGGSLSANFEQKVTWQPTRWDQCGGPFPPQASVFGRLLCLPAHDPKASEPLYFFTTGDWSAEQIGQLYALRWNVESDLRSLKHTVQLQQLTARTEDALEKELLLALAAYNLVRAVICLAAEKVQLPPRRFSFTNVYTLVETFSPQILTASQPHVQDACWQRIISLATQYVLPNRSKPRSYPRAIWPKSSKTFPANHAPRGLMNPVTSERRSGRKLNGIPVGR